MAETNILTYSIAREWLYGDAGGETFAVRAFSGGARGRKGSGAEHSLASYSAFRKTQHGKSIHGGPLPPGLYICRYVSNHPEFHACIFLEHTITALIDITPDAKVRFYDRGGFTFTAGDRTAATGVSCRKTRPSDSA